MDELDNILTRLQLVAASIGKKPCIPNVKRLVEERVQASNPYGCIQFRHGNGCRQRGTTRESKACKNVRKVYEVDQSQPMHKQVADLADAIKRAARDGERMEAVIKRLEFGELVLDCGAPGKRGKQDEGGHGVQHALEERHNVTPLDLARTLLCGTVSPHEVPSRLRITNGNVLVVVDREMKRGSGRSSRTKAKIITAMYNN